jgi:hypothetical protein
MKVVVTGATGNVGTCVVDALTGSDEIEEIVAIDYLSGICDLGGDRVLRGRERAMAFRGCAGVLLATLASCVAVCATASADTVIGELAPPSPSAICTAGPFDEAAAGPASAPDYTVPFAGTISSWSTQAAAGAGQELAFKVFRPEGVKFKVVAHDARALTPNTLNTFAVSIPVEAGDLIGSTTPRRLPPTHRPATSSPASRKTSTSTRKAMLLTGNPSKSEVTARPHCDRTSALLSPRPHRQVRHRLRRSLLRP